MAAAATEGAAEVAAASIVFGTPKDERSERLMRRWLNAECRDWRFDSGAQPGEGRVIAVSVVLETPKRVQQLRQVIAMHVKRWGFFRRAHSPNMLTPISIDKYMEGGTGELVNGRVRALLTGAVQKHAERADFIDRVRKQRQVEKLAAFKEKQLKKAAPELRLVLKGFWINASQERSEKNMAASRNFREDPKKKLRRIARNVDFEVKDDYTEEGEPIWERIDQRRRARA